MKVYLLLAIITLADGTPMGEIPLQPYGTYDECIIQAQPPNGWNHIEEIILEWHNYKQTDPSEVRDIDNVGLTCREVEADLGI